MRAMRAGGSYRGEREQGGWLPGSQLLVNI
jgi:hypothetical protein